MGTYNLGGKEVHFENLVEFSAKRGGVELTHHGRETVGDFNYSLTLEESRGRGRDESLTIWLTRDEVAALVLAFEKVKL